MRLFKLTCSILGFLIFGLALLLLGKSNLSREVPSQTKIPFYLDFGGCVHNSDFLCTFYFG